MTYAIVQARQSPGFVRKRSSEFPCRIVSLCLGDLIKLLCSVAGAINFVNDDVILM